LSDVRVFVQEHRPLTRPASNSSQLVRSEAGTQDLERPAYRYSDHHGFRSLPCLYLRYRNEVTILLGVHVDDGLLGCSHDAEFDIFLAQFKLHVRQAKITRNVLKYTGITMDVSREDHRVQLSHSVYIQQTIPAASVWNIRQSTQGGAPARKPLAIAGLRYISLYRRPLAS
jgi:hypothetical protein